MPIHKPSQYECDNMSPDDILYISKRNELYKLYRKYFKKNLIKLKVMEDNQQKEYYQEDYTIFFDYELGCIQRFQNDIPFCLDFFSKYDHHGTCYLVDVGLNNLQIRLTKEIGITIPINKIIKAIEDNKKQLNFLDNKKLSLQQLKFMKYKGDYYKKFVKDNNVIVYIHQFCSCCGEPLKFTFENDEVHIWSDCTCKTLAAYTDVISYDDMAILFAAETNEAYKQKIQEFWFKGKEV